MNPQTTVLQPMPVFLRALFLVTMVVGVGPLAALDKPLPPSLLNAIKAADPATFVALQVEHQTSTEDDGPEKGDSVGASVAMSGDWAAAGAPDEGDGLSIRVGSIYVFKRLSSGWELQQKIRPPRADVTHHLRFGFRVAMEGGKLLVGSGATAKIYAYQLSGEQWSYQSTFQTPHARNGTAVSSYALLLKGDKAVVGQPWDVTGYGKQGSAYVFEESGGVWTSTATLLPNGSRSNDEFGYSGAWDGDTLVLGAPSVEVGGVGSSNAGAVHVFRFMNGAWTHAQKITTPYPATFPYSNRDGFGSSVALSGTRLLVSAPLLKKTAYAYRDSIGVFSLEATLTAAYSDVKGVVVDGDRAAVLGGTADGLVLWRASGSNWTQSQVINRAAQSFASAAIASGCLVVGAPNGYENTPWPTSLRPLLFFNLVSDQWEAATLAMPAESTCDQGDNQGRSVAASGDCVVIGVPGDRDLAGGLATGRVDIYRRNAGNWALEASIKRPDRNTSARFGEAVSMDGDTLLVGAPIKRRDYPYYLEQAYVFEREGGQWGLQARLNQADDVNVRRFGSTVRIVGDTAAIGTDGLNVAKGDPLVRVFRRSGTTWALQSTLASPVAISANALEDGRYLSLAGDDQRWVIGLPLSGPANSPTFGTSGTAYIYARKGNDWALESTLTPAPELEGGFGSAVSIEGTTALISGAGKVGVYERLDGRWNQSALWSSPSNDALSGFGTALALQGNLALVGQSRDEYDFWAVPKVYGFVRRGDLWSMLPDSLALTGDTHTMFGRALALAGQTLAIGAPNWGSKLTALDGSGRAELGQIRQLPRLGVYEGEPDETLKVAAGSTLSIPDLLPGQPAFFDLVITNEGIGSLAIQSVHFTGDQATDFMLVEPDTSVMMPMSQRSLRVRALVPLGAVGVRNAMLTFSSNDPLQPGFNVNLEAQVHSASSAPSVTVPASAYLAGLGSTLRLVADAAGSRPINYQWFKDGRAIAGGVRRHLIIGSALLASAGKYQLRCSNAAGTGWSPVVLVGVVGEAPTAVQGLVDRTMTIQGPAVTGPGVTFTWSKDGSPLSDGAKYRGSRARSLSVHSAQQADEGTYALVVGLASATFNVRPVSATVLLRPVVDAFSFGPWDVAASVNESLTAQNRPAKFAVQGLPTGVLCHATTGRLSGRPLRSGTYQLAITASNAAGSSAVSRVTVVVAGLGDFAAGEYRGVIQRSLTCNARFGSALSVTFNASGAGTGTLTDDQGTTPFKTQFERLADRSLQASALLAGGVTRRLLMNVVPGTHRLTGNVSPVPASLLGHDPAPEILAFRNRFADHSGTSQRKGRYTFLFQAAAPAVGIPAGYGYAVVDVDAFGNASWAGRMADGEVVSFSTWLGPNDELLIHRMMAKSHSSVTGSIVISDNIAGQVDWYRSAMTGRVYSSGIPQHALALMGIRYLPPGSNGFLPLLSDASPNITLELSAAGLGSSFSNTLFLSSQSAVTWVNRPAGAYVTRLKFNVLTGTFTGSVKGMQPGTAWAEVPFFGAVLPSPVMGGGHFMRPLAVGGQSASSAPLESGRVVLAPVTP